MRFTTIDAKYPFDIPDLYCTGFWCLSEKLGVSIKKLQEWETAGTIPTRSKTTEWHHEKFYTNDEMKEAFIKGFIKLHKGG